MYVPFLNFIYVFGCMLTKVSSDVGRTLTEGGYDDVIGMTDEDCIDYCNSLGYVYAGTEYYHECFCGNELAEGAGPAPSTDCNTPCVGDPTETCGGPDRLTLFWSGSSGPQINPGSGLWTFAGCYMQVDVLNFTP